MLGEVKKFYDQVKQEALRVVWPSRKELIVSTGIVLVVVTVFSVICLFVDYGIHNFIKLMLKLS